MAKAHATRADRLHAFEREYADKRFRHLVKPKLVEYAKEFHTSDSMWVQRALSRLRDGVPLEDLA